MAERAIELLALPYDGRSRLILDLGCGSGLSGGVISRAGHYWIGLDISKSMLDIAQERFNGGYKESVEANMEMDGENLDEESMADYIADSESINSSEGRDDEKFDACVDLLQGDIGEGIPFRPGIFDGCISISALQWLCHSNRCYENPKSRLTRLFSTLFSNLSRGARAIFQFYPETSSQIDLILACATKAGFTGGLVVDYPNCPRTKKYYLCLMTGSLAEIPKALDSAENEQHVGIDKRSIKKRRKDGRTVHNKAWVMKKKESARKRGEEDDSVWVHDDINCWSAAKVVLLDDDKISVQLDETGEMRVLGKDDILERNSTLNEDRIDDLTGLAYLNEGAGSFITSSSSYSIIVFNAIKSRYLDGNIYTYSGIVLASVNPYRRLPIYEREVIWAYNDRRRDELAPHLFAIVEEAYQSLRTDRKSQSIIVSGESGAGKTISAKYIMRYLAELCSNGSPLLTDEVGRSATLEEKILATSPILEAFGNAKTMKNDNSSRFGKYIQIYFDAETNITGAAIKSFLLEKTRVISQAKKERNFHVFYQLLAGCPDIERRELRLLDWHKFRYLSVSDTGTIDGVDDAAEFNLTMEALKIAGFTDEHQWNIFKILATILYLGNIQFVEDSQGYAQIDKGSMLTVQWTADLLGINVDDLQKSFTRRKIAAAGEIVDAFNTIIQAEAARDVFAKHLYAEVFEHIIFRLNQTLIPKNDEHRFIGVLDIYGFERFEANSFEQFCINYANEKLQHMFNTHVFDLEQKLYTEEGIEWSFIDFADNQLCIDLIEAKMGILDLLDEECKFPNGTDSSFVAKLLDSHGKTDQGKFLFKAKLASPNSFVIKHFAYEVEYSADHFLEKNRDNLAPDLLINLLLSSRIDYIRNLTSSRIRSEPNTPTKRSKEEPRQWRNSTGSLFKQSLIALMNTLYSTKVHYIRCIKPNEDKAPFSFNGPFVMQQLQACGILETIRISAAGFPGRWTFFDFIERFSLLANDTLAIRNNQDFRKACQILLEELKMPMDDFQVGKTKIFMRAGVLAALEIGRTTKLNLSAKCVQKMARMILAQKVVAGLLKSVLCITGLTKLYLAQLVFENLLRERASVYIASSYRRYRSITLVTEAISSLNIIISHLRRMLSCWHFSAMMNQRAALIIINYLRYYHSYGSYRSQLHIALVVQSRYRHSLAWMALLKLREEARSFEHLKETSEFQERRITELMHQLKLADEHLSYERTVNANLKQQVSEELFSSAKLSELDQIIREKDEIITRLTAQIDDLRLNIESYQSIMENLEVANSELFQRNEDLSKKLKMFRLERLNADHIAPLTQHQSLANIVLRDTTIPPKTLKHLRMLSYDSTLTRLSHLMLPDITRPVSIYHLENKSSELIIALNDPACLTELVQIINSINAEVQNDFVPSKIFSLWIMSWLRVRSNSNLIQTYLSEVLGHIKLGLMGNNPRRRQAIGARPIDVDARFSFWIANLFEFLGFLQYAVVDTMEHQKDPMEVPSDQMVALMQLRTDVARVVEELCRAWLTDLFRGFVKLGISALLDHQGLSGFSSEQDSPIIQQTSFRLLMIPFSKFSNANGTISSSNDHSIEDLIIALGKLAKAMENSQLQQELTMQIMSAVLNNICSSTFNQLVLRKNYATWKRGIQIQYNISRLEEWATSLNHTHPHYFFSSSALASPLSSPNSSHTQSEISLSSNSPLVCIEPLIQAVKLLQLAKTRAANDVDILIGACPRLTLPQIRKILSVYVPDAYEDGPVALEVLRSLTSRLNTQGKSDLVEILPEIQPQVLPLQLSIKPMPPVPFSQLPSTIIPPHLWKIFALTESCEQLRMGEAE